MAQFRDEINLAHNLLWDRDSKGVELAVTLLEREIESNQAAYYRGHLIYLIEYRDLDITSYIDRLRNVFLRDLEDAREHGQDWFPWTKQIVSQITNPEIHRIVIEHLNDPNMSIRRRAWLISTYMNTSPLREAQKSLIRLRQVRSESESNRNLIYATVYQWFLDLVETRIEWEEYVQLREEERISRDKKGQNYTEAENDVWTRGLLAIFNRFRGSPIWQSIYRLGEKKIKSRDPVAIEVGILYLEVDPYWGGSGYTKEWILDQIKYIDFPPYVSRLQNIMLHVVDTHYCREFRHYCKVAVRIDGKEFREALQSRLTKSDPNIVQRAQWMLDFLGRYGKLGKSVP